MNYTSEIDAYLEEAKNMGDHMGTSQTVDYEASGLGDVDCLDSCTVHDTCIAQRTVRIEQKLDALIELLEQLGEGFGNALEQMQDSPLGKMLGKFLGDNG